jgi:hypothetical protein
VLATFAHCERRSISERTRAALARKRAQGVRLGRPPQMSQHAIERIRHERAAGRSLAAIANGLNADRIPHRPGRSPLVSGHRPLHAQPNRLTQGPRRSLREPRHEAKTHLGTPLSLALSHSDGDSAAWLRGFEPVLVALSVTDNAKAQMNARSVSVPLAAGCSIATTFLRTRRHALPTAVSALRHERDHDGYAVSCESSTRPPTSNGSGLSPRLTLRADAARCVAPRAASRNP